MPCSTASEARPARIQGAFVTIVNNSMRVGKPLGLMLENLGATVVKCWHVTRPDDLERCVRSADILVVGRVMPRGTGRPSDLRRAPGRSVVPERTHPYHAAQTGVNRGSSRMDNS